MNSKLAEVVDALPDGRAEQISEAERALRQAEGRHRAATRAFARSRAKVTWSPDTPAPDSPEFARLARAHEGAHRAYTETGIAWAAAEDHLTQLKSKGA